MNFIAIYCYISLGFMLVSLIQLYFIIKHIPEYKLINWASPDTSIFETIFTIFKLYLMFLVPIFRWFLLMMFLFDDSIPGFVKDKMKELYQKQMREKSEENL